MHLQQLPMRMTLAQQCSSNSSNRTSQQIGLLELELEQVQQSLVSSSTCNSHNNSSSKKGKRMIVMTNLLE